MQLLKTIFYFALVVSSSCKTQDDNDAQLSADEENELASVAVYLGEETEGIEDAKEPVQISGVNLSLTASAGSISRVDIQTDGSVQITESETIAVSTKKTEVKLEPGHFHIVKIGTHGVVIPPASDIEAGQPPFMGIVADRASTTTTELFQQIAMDPQGRVLISRNVIDLPALYELGSLLGVAGEESKILLQDKIVTEFIANNTEMASLLNLNALTDETIFATLSQAIRSTWTPALIEADLLDGTYNTVKATQMLATESKILLKKDIQDKDVDIDVTANVAKTIIAEESSSNKGYEEFVAVYAYATLLPTLAATSEKLDKTQQARAQKLLLREVLALPLTESLAIVAGKTTTPLLEGLAVDPDAAINDQCSGSNATSPECDVKPILNAADLEPPVDGGETGDGTDSVEIDGSDDPDAGETDNDGDIDTDGTDGVEDTETVSTDIGDDAGGDSGGDTGAGGDTNGDAEDCSISLRNEIYLQPPMAPPPGC